MKTCSYIILMLALLAAGTAFAAQVTKVDLSHVNGGMIATIGVQGPFQFVHTAQAPKDGKSDRLIVDVLDATHNWGPKEWSMLPACGIAAVRVGQFSSKPDKVVRIVFDLAKAPIYRVDSDPSGIKIYFTDNTLKPFAAWTTGPAPSTPPVIVPAAPAPSTAATPTPAPVTPVVKPAAKPAPVASVTPKVDVAPTPTQHAALASKPVTVTPTAPKPVASTPSEPKGIVTMSKPVVAVQAPQTKPVTVVPPAVKPDVKPAAPAPTAAVTAKPSTPVEQKKVEGAPVTSSPKPTTTASVTPPAAAPKTDAVKPAATPVPVVPAAGKPEQLAKASDFKVTALVNAPAKPAATPPAAVASTAPAVVSADKPAATKAPADNALVVKPTEGETSAPTTDPENPVLADAGTPTDGTVAGSVRPTARFRRSANSKMKSSLVAEFPQRLVIKYESMGYRDPFATLIDDTRTYDSPLEQRIPNVDGLKLVGIIESTDGGDNRALFEDKHHFSYILQSGDKVQKGYVLRVEDDRVYFQIFEYGWSRTIALTLENRE